MSDVNTPDLEDLLRLGIRTAKAGNKEGARVMFQQVLDIDKRNERAWLWMASVSDNELDRRRYLETVVRLNPDNQMAKKYLSSLDHALVSSDRDSIALGVKILVALVAFLVVVGIVVFIVSR